MNARRHAASAGAAAALTLVLLLAACADRTDAGNDEHRGFYGGISSGLGRP